jgi:hypothetical protein
VNSFSAIALLGVFCAALLAGLALLVMTYRTAPRDRERSRRYVLHRTGRMTDGEVTDAQDTVIYYAYDVSGVTYSATQDVAALTDRLPRDFSILVGPATIKYSLKNPANSIVMCEEWTGLRSRRRMAVDPETEKRKGA